MMKVFVRNYMGTTGIWLELPCIPQKGEYLVFSVLKGTDDISHKVQKLAEDSTDFLIADEEENETGNPAYIVTSRTFHNNGVVELCVRVEDLV